MCICCTVLVCEIRDNDKDDDDDNDVCDGDDILCLTMD